MKVERLGDRLHIDDGRGHDLYWPMEQSAKVRWLLATTGQEQNEAGAVHVLWDALRKKWTTLITKGGITLRLCGNEWRTTIAAIKALENEGQEPHTIDESVAVNPRSATFDEAAARLIARAQEVWDAKVSSYTHGAADPLANFRRAAVELSTTPQQVAATYFYKHVSSILSIAAGGEDGGEPILDRAADAVNYLKVLVTLIEEAQ